MAASIANRAKPKLKKKVSLVLWGRIIFFLFRPVATMSKKGATPQKPTMKISSGLKEKLKNLKRESDKLEKASLEEVVAWLLKGHGVAIGADDAEDEPSLGPEKDAN